MTFLVGFLSCMFKYPRATAKGINKGKKENKESFLQKPFKVYIVFNIYIPSACVCSCGCMWEECTYMCTH